MPLAESEWSRRMAHLAMAVIALIVGVGLGGCCGRTVPGAVVGQPAVARWYEAELLAFEESDRLSPPAPGQVLFVGSSSIRLWDSLARDMAPVPVLSRGFGGSKTGEVLGVFERIVVPYKPCAIVYYCGDNDLGTESTDSAAAAAGFIEFDRRVHDLWPDVRVLYIAIKPSLARWSNWPAMRRANEIVEAHCAAHSHSEFLDTATPLLTHDGVPDSRYFQPDGLHLNQAGYEVWRSVIRPRVLRAWEEGGTSREVSPSPMHIPGARNR